METLKYKHVISRMRCSPTLVLSIYAISLPLSVYGAARSLKERATAMSTSSLHCWQEEEFTILALCAQCTPFQMKSWPPCHLTGFIEQINCSKSNKLEQKSCRSLRQEEKLFWKFEGVMMTLTVVFILLVIARQRGLDRLASEKVRRQIESI
ncbi:protein JTB-like isoform X2 [Hypomesus transpacificus]|uniref:protein JTB-like isoform X2 n=1 Tax=Hypomesus transpacificus TaxID=137520 RepID=UPI001F079025|nr:protein JTB-like isoform X2 [Hypomesus transpacificus]